MKMNEIVNEARFFGLWKDTEDFEDMPPPPAVYAKYAQPHPDYPELKTIHGNLRELAANREDVRAMQAWLNQAGYEAGTEDGAWGPNTHTALATFNSAFVRSYAKAIKERNLNRFFTVVSGVMFVANPTQWIAKRLEGAAADAAVGAVTRAFTGNTST